MNTMKHKQMPTGGRYRDLRGRIGFRLREPLVFLGGSACAIPQENCIYTIRRAAPSGEWITTKAYNRHVRKYLVGDA